MTALELWKALKWSTQLPDGSITISAERVELIDKELSATDPVKMSVTGTNPEDTLGNTLDSYRR